MTSDEIVKEVLKHIATKPSTIKMHLRSIANKSGNKYTLK